MPDVPASAWALDVADLTLRLGDRTLFDGAALQLAPGEVVLLVGDSGTGKSVFLRLVQGLLDPATPGLYVAGRVLVGGDDVLRPFSRGRAVRRVGLVFQEGGLFDELSVMQNLAFAHDHSPRRRPRRERAAHLDALRETLGLRRDLVVPRASGGERRRLAVARTLAYDPELLLYDEPTTGLDPVHAAAVARLIRDTNARFGKTTLIVTHDAPHFAGVADRTLRLDTAAGRFVGVRGEESDSQSSARRGALHAPLPPASLSPQHSFPRRAARALGRFFEGTTRALEFFLLVPLLLVPWWRRARWGAQYLAHYLRLVAGPSSLLYLGAAGALIGFVIPYFTFRFFPYQSFTTPLLEDELLRAIGLMTFRVFVPLFAGLLVAARCSAAVTADLGNRRTSSQFEALASLGVRPGRYLGTGVLWAFLVGTPLLTAWAYAWAELASAAGYLSIQPEATVHFWSRHYHFLLRPERGGAAAHPAAGLLDDAVYASLHYQGGGWMLVKALLFGFGAGVASWYFGARPQRSAVDVGRAVTAAILWATLFVLVVAAVFATFEFDGLPGVDI